MIEDNPDLFIDWRGYRGNQLIKKSGVQIAWTQEMVSEYMKCSQDPFYFIETYVKIISLDRGLIPFILRDYQQDMVRSFHDNRFTILCCARQSGKSTAFIGYLIWYVIFNPYKTVAILANKAETARELLGRIQLAWENIPKWLQQGVVEGGWNKGSMDLENDSRIIAESSSSDSIRGYSINLLVLDEAARIEHWDEFQSSTLPTITSGTTTKIIQVSTPKGLNHFYKIWSDAIAKKNDYHPILVRWTQVPGRDDNWKKYTIANELNNDLEKFDQEYNCEFMGSSGTLIAGWKLKELVSQTPMEYKLGLSQYKKPLKDHTYAITVDVSEGKGLDYSVFHVSDITAMPFEQVATFRSNMMTPQDFAESIHIAAKSYNNSLVLIEYASLGPEVAYILYNDYEYDGILSTESAGSRGKKLSGGSGRMVDMGIKMSVSVKNTGCSLLKLLIEQNQYIINDFHTIEELSRFSRQGNTYKAEEGWHDDCVMSLVVFAWLSNQQYFKDMTNVNTLAHLRDSTEQQLQDEYSSMIGFSTYGDDKPDTENLEVVPWGEMTTGWKRKGEKIVEKDMFKGWMTDEDFDLNNPFQDDVPKHVYRFGVKSS